jgi:hypothetical protein
MLRVYPRSLLGVGVSNNLEASDLASESQNACLPQALLSSDRLYSIVMQRNYSTGLLFVLYHQYLLASLLLYPNLPAEYLPKVRSLGNSLAKSRMSRL